MNTYEDIFNGLACCVTAGKSCTKCPYTKESFPKCRETLMKDSYDYTVQLQSGIDEWGMVAASPGAVEDMARENTELLQKIKQLEQERDAAVADLKKMCAECSNDTLCCNYCKYQEDDLQCHHDCKMYTKEWDWQWRGVKEGGKIG